MEIVRDTEKNRLLITEGQLSSSVHQDFREKMLINNNPEGILALKVYVTDNRKTFEYDTSGLCTLENFFHEKSIDLKALKGVFGGIAETVIKAGNYMLEESDFLIGPDHVFVGRDNRPYIAYCPGYGKPLREQFGNLAEYFMNRIDYHDQKAVLFTYTLYMKCREEGFCVSDIKDYLEGEDKTDTLHEAQKECPNVRNTAIISREEEMTAFYREPEEMKPVPKKSFMFGNLNIKIAALAVVCPLILVIAALSSKVLNTPQGKPDLVKLAALILAGGGASFYVIRKYAIRSGKGKDDNEGFKAGGAEDVTELLFTGNGAMDEKTELLFDPSEVSKIHETVRLTSKTCPVITITGFPFYIGKDSAHMDYYLNYQGVSRYHVKIDREALGYQVYDLSSTNGTYLNGTRIEPNRPYRLNKGDVVGIGVCSYTVEIK